MTISSTALSPLNSASTNHSPVCRTHQPATHTTHRSRSLLFALAATIASKQVTAFTPIGIPRPPLTTSPLPSAPLRSPTNSPNQQLKTIKPLSLHSTPPHLESWNTLSMNDAFSQLTSTLSKHVLVINQQDLKTLAIEDQDEYTLFQPIGETFVDVLILEEEASLLRHIHDLTQFTTGRVDTCLGLVIIDNELELESIRETLLRQFNGVWVDKMLPKFHIDDTTGKPQQFAIDLSSLIIESVAEALKTYVTEERKAFCKNISPEGHDQSEKWGDLFSHLKIHVLSTALEGLPEHIKPALSERFEINNMIRQTASIFRPYS